MENGILIIHLVVAVALIGVVLLQRSEGGALGMGGGGGGGVMSARGAATALSKVTWGLAAAFIATSLALTIIAASGTGSRSVVDGVDTGAPAADAPQTPAAGGFSLPNIKTEEPAPSSTEPPAAD